MDQHKKIAFIGAGNMARAMIAGLLNNGFPADHIWASSPNVEKHEKIKQKFGIHLTANNAEAAKQADVIVFAVKPWVMQPVCAELKKIIQAKKPLLISLVTGTKTTRIVDWCENGYAALIRTMPNIASAVGAGATGLYANAHATEDQKAFAESLFRSIGTTIWLQQEDHLDVITAISGSGPAYLFYVYEAMQKAAQALGLSEAQAKLLVAQTATGAAKMVMETEDSFEMLRRLVTAEKGTTAAATQVFDQHDMQGIIKQAIQAAHHRAKELSQ
jgi:pyrroline-5-carboxylate reductase